MEEAKNLAGFTAEFQIYVGDQQLLSSGHRSACSHRIGAGITPPWWSDVVPAAPDFGGCATPFQITLSALSLIGEDFLWAQLQVRDAGGNPLAYAQPLKCWLPKNPADHGQVGAVTQLAPGYWDGKGREHIAVMTTIINPHWETVIPRG